MWIFQGFNIQPPYFLDEVLNFPWKGFWYILNKDHLFLGNMFCLRVFGLCFNRIKFRVDLISWTSFKTAENGNFWAQIEKVKKSRSIFQEHCCTLSSLQLYYIVKEMFITAKRDWFDAILFQLLYIGIGRFNTTIYDLDAKTATSSMAGLFCYQGLLTWKPIFFFD